MAEENNESVMALILIRIDPLVERKLLDELKGFEGVKEAHLIYGPYDAYCEVECPSYDALTDIVMNKIRGIHGVKSTTTCYIA